MDLETGEVVCTVCNKQMVSGHMESGTHRQRMGPSWADGDRETWRRYNLTEFRNAAPMGGDGRAAGANPCALVSRAHGAAAVHPGRSCHLGRRRAASAPARPCPDALLRRADRAPSMHAADGHELPRCIPPVLAARPAGRRRGLAAVERQLVAARRAGLVGGVSVGQWEESPWRQWEEWRR